MPHTPYYSHLTLIAIPVQAPTCLPIHSPTPSGRPWVRYPTQAFHSDGEDTVLVSPTWEASPTSLTGFMEIHPTLRQSPLPCSACAPWRDYHTHLHTEEIQGEDKKNGLGGWVTSHRQLPHAPLFIPTVYWTCNASATVRRTHSVTCSQTEAEAGELG